MNPADKAALEALISELGTYYNAKHTAADRANLVTWWDRDLGVYQIDEIRAAVDEYRKSGAAKFPHSAIISRYLAASNRKPSARTGEYHATAAALAEKYGAEAMAIPCATSAVPTDYHTVEYYTRRMFTTGYRMRVLWVNSAELERSIESMAGFLAAKYTESEYKDINEARQALGHPALPDREFYADTWPTDEVTTGVQINTAELVAGGNMRTVSAAEQRAAYYEARRMEREAELAF